MLTFKLIVDEALRALADRTRRRILSLVWHHERSAGDIAKDFSISRPAVSQHLGVLRASKLVILRRAGTRCLYRANHAAIARLRAELGAFWDDRLNALKDRLEAAERRRRQP
jgi:DNA-binding transcriptional ArsR family regulator